LENAELIADVLEIESPLPEGITRQFPECRIAIVAVNDGVKQRAATGKLVETLRVVLASN
jgi:hypothetical protein